MVGNHDEKGLQDYRVKQLFESVVDYFELMDNHNGINQKIVLSHYPIFHGMVVIKIQSFSMVIHMATSTTLSIRNPWKNSDIK